MNYKFYDGQQVTIHSLGDGNEYQGIIRGIAVNDTLMPIYIIEMLDRPYAEEYDYPFSCYTVPACCIR